MVRANLALVAAMLVVSAAANPVFKRDVNKIKSDLTFVGSNTTKLDNDVKAFPASGATSAQVLNINTDTSNLNTAIKQTTTDVNANGKLSETDGKAILTQLQGLEPGILDALTQTTNKKSAFQNTAIGNADPIVESDLKILNASTVALENALLAVFPADLQANATAIKNTINAAFAKALAAFTS